jgi:competence protein ComEA
MSGFLPLSARSSPSAGDRLRHLTATGETVLIDVEESGPSGRDPVDLPPQPRSWLSSRLPATLRSGRWAIDRRGVWALLSLAAAGVLVAAWFASRGSSAPIPAERPSPVGVATSGQPSDARGAAAASGSPGGSTRGAASGMPMASGSGSAGVVVVDVAGRVRKSGLVRLPSGSRIADAIQAAGGALPGVDLSSINLARVLADGEQVVVGGPPVAGGAAVPATGIGGAGASGGAGSGVPTAASPLDLNTATLEQLQTLPGVGPVLAQRILDWRTGHGRFGSVDDLRNVSGIGERT